ncbi:MAG: hypothetical protein MI755_06210, partial [Sphingomonadales bacterium]|nr:hypothetical protein [Sphingomonadales bacterium]
MSDPASDALELKVCEALQKDVGRGIARIDPEDMKRIGAKTGDLLEIAGARASVVKLMATFPDQRGKGSVQIDGLTRQNAGVGLNDRARLRPTAWKPARKLELAPSGDWHGADGGQKGRFIGHLLEGLAVMEGDRVRATLIGSRNQDFSVLRTVPKGAVVIGPATAIETRRPTDRSGPDQRIAYEDIGGLKRELGSIREMIEMPLRYPEIFEQLGIDAPK